LYAAIDHNHTGVYASIDHVHSQYLTQSFTDSTYLKISDYDGGGGGGSFEWDDILNKPTSFAPSTHAHSISHIQGLQLTLNSKAFTADLDNKADVFHTHIISDVTNLQSSLDGKASTSHVHDDRYALISHHHDQQYLKLTDASNTYLKIVDYNGGSGYVEWVDILNKPLQFNPSAHTHVISDVTNLQSSLDGKASTSHNHNGVYAYINHTHPYALLNHVHEYNSLLNIPSTFPPSTHVHNWDDIQNKPVQFNPLYHMHFWSDINGKPNFDSLYAAIEHNHTGVYSSIDHNSQYATLDHTHTQFSPSLVIAEGGGMTSPYSYHTRGISLTSSTNGNKSSSLRLDDYNNQSRLIAGIEEMGQFVIASGAMSYTSTIVETNGNMKMGLQMNNEFVNPAMNVYGNIVSKAGNNQPGDIKAEGRIRGDYLIAI